MNKKHLIPIGVLAGALVLTGIYGVSTVSAATDADNLPPMVQRMAERFNLNKDEVAKFVDEDRVNIQAERKADFEAKLSEAVTAGKITEDQKSAIIAKHEELGAKRDALREERTEDREAFRDQMEALRTEMTDFLKSQGIDESIMPEPKGPRGGMGGGMMGEGRGGFGGGRMHSSTN
jgi:hypothetical protein